MKHTNKAFAAIFINLVFLIYFCELIFLEIDFVLNLTTPLIFLSCFD